MLTQTQLKAVCIGLDNLLEKSESLPGFDL